MASRFQAVPLVASPSYPNAVAWSNENLIAVASGHLVTILNPAMPFGPKGLITISTSQPFPIGVIERKDLFSGCLLPTCLARDVRPCVRSITWSPSGLAPNAGCLLAVCTTEGSVKLYRSPFHEFSAEWVEVMDVSEMLCTYYAKVRFGEVNVPSSQFSRDQVNQVVREHGCNNEHPISDMGVRKRKIQNVLERSDLPLISAEQYACRSAMLSSLVVAFSPDLRDHSSSIGCSILAIGAKSGKISFLRVYEPQCYSISQRSKPAGAEVIGVLQAHSGWITAVSWSKLVSDAVNPQLLLATGSSDGSVNIWWGYIDELLKSSEDSYASFSLLREVTKVGSGPVSVLSLLVPETSAHKVALAVGRGSGSLEVWNYDISIDKLEPVGQDNAHDQIVTGLAWAYGGRCLYSCSQENTLHGWIVSGGSLHEIPLPSNILGVKSSPDVPNVYDLCFGLAVSPGNLVVVVVKNLINLSYEKDVNIIIKVAVRSFDLNLLNPMYQQRSQKAAVEFFWIGGQKLESLMQKVPKFDVERFPGFPDMDLVCWGYNLLWSLNQYEHLDKPLVLWDIVAALLAFKQSVPHYLEQILVKWLVLNLGFECGLSVTSILPNSSTRLLNLSTRQLHILNIINRHAILKEPKEDEVNSEEHGFEKEQLVLWNELLEMTEKELRQRLVGCSFSATINLVSYLPTDGLRNGYWQPVGLGQMKQWVANNDSHVKYFLKLLESEVKKLEKRIRSIYKYVTEEECSYCSAPVPFEDPEVAFCEADKCIDGGGQKHKLARCAVTMVVCPLSPSWFCVCCHRWVSHLAPQSFFTLPRYPLTVDSNAIYSSNAEILSKPLCPYCGVLLQRSQPDFLLSTSPV